MEVINKDTFQTIVAIAIIVAFVGWVIAAFIFGKWQGVNAALKSSRENVVALNSVEHELFTRLSPDAIGMVRGAGMGVFALLAAANIDKETIERAKDIFNVATDGAPNVPPVEVAGNAAASAAADK